MGLTSNGGGGSGCLSATVVAAAVGAVGAIVAALIPVIGSRLPAAPSPQQPPAVVVKPDARSAWSSFEQAHVGAAARLADDLRYQDLVAKALAAQDRYNALEAEGDKVDAGALRGADAQLDGARSALQGYTAACTAADPQLAASAAAVERFVPVDGPGRSPPPAGGGEPQLAAADEGPAAADPWMVAAAQTNTTFVTAESQVIVERDRTADAYQQAVDHLQNRGIGDLFTDVADQQAEVDALDARLRQQNAMLMALTAARGDYGRLLQRSSLRLSPVQLARLTTTVQAMSVPAPQVRALATPFPPGRAGALKPVTPNATWAAVHQRVVQADVEKRDQAVARGQAHGGEPPNGGHHPPTPEHLAPATPVPHPHPAAPAPAGHSGGRR